MEITKQNLMRDISALGIHTGDTLLVHSSIKSLGGQISGGCETVIQALLSVLGESGTLLMPALSYETVTRDTPHFSVKETPSCVGRLSETFRQMPGVLRSVHPTHSVCACGRLANELTCAHIEDRTPVGPHSPFRRMMAYGGKILMLGCGLLPNTFMHGVEEQNGAPYCLSNQTVDFECELADGTNVTATHTPHNFAGVAQRYDRIADILDEPEIHSGKIAAADCFLIDSNALWKKGTEKIKSSPLYFIDFQHE